MAQGQINRGSNLGETIYSLAKKDDVNVIVEIGTWNGAGGQDASYLAEHLILDGYEVHGLERSRSKEECKFVPSQVVWHKGDICDFYFLESLLCEIKPSRIYNLAAQLEVRLSCDLPHLTTTVNSIGALNMLEAFRRCCPSSRRRWTTSTSKAVR